MQLKEREKNLKQRKNAVKILASSVLRRQSISKSFEEDWDFRTFNF